MATTSRASSARWPLRIVTAIIGGGALLYLLGFAYVFAKSKYQASTLSWPSETFTAEAWKSSAPAQRYRFYRDLARKRLLEGKSESGVVDLLGPPDEPPVPSHARMTYIVKEAGPREYTFNFVYYVEINLSPQGVVTSYAIRSD